MPDSLKAHFLGQALVKIFGNNAPQPSIPGQMNAPISPTVPTPKVTPTLPASGTTAASMLDQINQARSILDNLETQLKGMSSGSLPSSSPKQ